MKRRSTNDHANVFVLDTNPLVAAEYYNDRHVAKGILDLCQLLSGAHLDLDGEQMARKRVPGLMPATFRTMYHQKEHPWVVWVRESSRNYTWAALHLTGLMAEYTIRNGVSHSMATSGGAADQLRSTLPLKLEVREQTPFPIYVPHEFVRASAVESYRLFYYRTKQNLASWKVRGEPQWWTEMRKAEGALA